MSDRIKETIKKAKELVAFCPSKEEKNQIERMITLIEMLKFDEENVKKHLSEDDTKKFEEAIAIIDKLYSMVAAN